MERLERFRGHFYNWYDTRDLRPLEPRYVSSVDSGNLAGHLLALAQRLPARWPVGPMREPRSGSLASATRWRSPASRCAAAPTTAAPRR